MVPPSPSASNLFRGTAVALGDWAVLLRGPSGSGKSDLALRLIHAGHTLVSDDYVELTIEPRFITAAPPEPLKGLLEVRGLGVVTLAWRAHVPLGLLVDLVDAGAIERMPDARLEDVLGVQLPVLALAAFESSAPAKVELALKSLLS